MPTVTLHCKVLLGSPGIHVDVALTRTRNQNTVTQAHSIMTAAFLMTRTIVPIKLNIKT